MSGPDCAHQLRAGQRKQKRALGALETSPSPGAASMEAKPGDIPPRPLTIRLTGPRGTSRLQVDHTASAGDLFAAAEAALNSVPGSLALSFDLPGKRQLARDGQSLRQCGLAHGDQVFVQTGVSEYMSEPSAMQVDSAEDKPKPVLAGVNTTELEAMLSSQIRPKRPGWTVEHGAGGFWFWHCQRLWRPYGLAESAQIEAAFAAGAKSQLLDSSVQPAVYRVDLEKMLQVRLEDSERTRTIARKVLAPGLAEAYPCPVPLDWEEMWTLGREHGHLTQLEIASCQLSSELTAAALAAYELDASSASQQEASCSENNCSSAAPEAGRLCEHLSFRASSSPETLRASIYSSARDLFPAARAQEVAADGGATSVACDLFAERERRIGLMVAANSGRPAGACGLCGKVQKIHPGHGTQEEDIVSNWLSTTVGTARETQDRLYCRTIDRQWGMCSVNSKSPRTIQRVDYTRADQAQLFGDAWVVPATHVQVCRKRQGPPPSFQLEDRCPVTLVFCAGPNAGCRQSPTGSTTRTFCTAAVADYALFKSCVAAAVRTGLDAMVKAGCTVALVARLSCGIYGGPHQRQISEEFSAMVDQILQEEVLHGRTRGSFFERVLIPMLRHV